MCPCPCVHNQSAVFIHKSTHWHTHTLTLRCALCVLNVCVCAIGVLYQAMSASTYISFSVCSNWNVHKYRICDLSIGVFCVAAVAAARHFSSDAYAYVTKANMHTQRDREKEAFSGSRSSRSHIYLQSQTTHVHINYSTMYWHRMAGRRAQHRAHILVHSKFGFSLFAFGLALFIRSSNRVSARPTYLPNTQTHSPHCTGTSTHTHTPAGVKPKIKCIKRTKYCAKWIYGNKRSEKRKKTRNRQWTRTTTTTTSH